jgi:hypothetical protein
MACTVLSWSRLTGIARARFVGKITLKSWKYNVDKVVSRKRGL